METINEKLARQIAIETEMIQSGIMAYRKQVEAAKAQTIVNESTGKSRRKESTEDRLPASLAIMRRLIEPLSTAIDSWVAAQGSKGSGRLAAAGRLIPQVPSDALAFVALQVTFSGLSGSMPLTQVALILGQRVEDEIRFASLQSEAPKLYSKLRRELPKQTSHRRHTRAVLVHACSKAAVTPTGWSKADRLKVGTVLAELVSSSTGLTVHVNIQKTKRKMVTMVQATEAASILIADQHARCELLQPKYLPMIVKPLAWEGIWGGGYVSDQIDRSQLPMIKSTNAAYLNSMDENASEMPAVYAAVNALQNVSWMVNSDLLDVAKQLWDCGHKIGKAMPQRSPVDLPPQPADFLTNDDAKQAWKVAASKIHKYNVKRVSRCIQAQTLLTIADKFDGESEIFFPMQVDFRGRVYSIANSLSPQGSDLAKSLLLFADGAAIETDEAVSWLAVTGAGFFGFDKVSLADRVVWVGEHADEIREAAADPISSTWWKDADKPFQFLAWCMEWAEFNRVGMGYVSHFPVQIDGTCNGLQNFAGMLRDEVSGRAVNLTCTSDPQDIYRSVAEKATQLLIDSDDLLADEWLVYGVDRKLTKRPVMVLPYGGTMHSCRAYVAAHVIERDENQTQVSPWGTGDKELFAPSQFLAKIIWEAISEVVTAAKEVMSWLQKVTATCNKEGTPICWTTPTGFVVFQKYHDTKKQMVNLKYPEAIMRTKRRQLSLRVETDEMDKRRQVSAISPNFIHSMDASHLMMTVNAASCQVGTVHDAYFVHAAHAEHLGETIRSTFVAMYTQADVLADFAAAQQDNLDEATSLPAPPAMGNLDLAQVINSEYFFC